MCGNCGVTPRNASSGARQADAGLIRAGNPELRTGLVELAHRLIRGLDPHWAKLAHGMLARQTEERRHRGGRQPLGAVAAPRTAATDTNLGSGSTKGGRPYRLHHRIDLARVKAGAR